MDPDVQPHQDPKYRGVRKRKWGKWVSEIRFPNSRERVWLGSFDTPKKAARAFDAAQYCLRGRNAQFNFPGSSPDIPVTPSLSHKEIRAIAARFANEWEDGEVSTAAGTDASVGTSHEAGSSECRNMGWPFLDKWFDDDRIYGGMGYMGSNDLQGLDDRVIEPADDNNNDGGDEDGELRGPSFLWNF